MWRAIPWITQYASASLIADMTYGGRAPADDPRWRESGAPDQETYAAWCSRWCGMACFRMALLARDRHGLRADVITDLRPATLITELDAGQLVIASVHPEIRRPGIDPPGTGGHLVLVTGHGNGQVTFHNPSGHVPEAVVATLPMPVFDRFAAHRGIALHRAAAEGGGRPAA